MYFIGVSFLSSFSNLKFMRSSPCWGLKELLTYKIDFYATKVQYVMLALTPGHNLSVTKLVVFTTR